MASGKFGGGTGAASNPYIIEDVQDLNAIRFYPTQSFKLSQSINLGVYPYNVGLGWMPISNFCGTLDGNGHKIMNMYINRPQQNYVGFFDTMYKKTNIDLNIKNLQFFNANVIGKDNVGVLAGAINIQETVAAQKSYIVEKCDFKGTIKGANNLGAMIGSLAWSGLSWVLPFVNNVKTKVNITLSASGANYSGLLGYGAFTGGTVTVDNFLSDCSFDPTVNGTVTQLSPNHWGTTTTNVYTANTTMLFNTDSWKFGTKTNGMNTQQLSNHIVGKFDKQIEKDDYGNIIMIWNFNNGKRLPELNSFLPKKSFIKTSQGYFIYDFNSSKWVKKIDKIITREQLLLNGMTNVNNIPFQGWQALQAMLPSGETSFTIVQVVEDVNGTTFSEQVLAMEADTTHTLTDTNKKLFKKKFTFSLEDGTKPFGDVIVQMNKGIIR